MAATAAINIAAKTMNSQVAMPVARFQIFTTIAAAETDWRDLEARNAWGTPFQRFEFLDNWQKHIGSSEGYSPLIVVAYNAQNIPLLLLPLVVRREFGMVNACFMGGKHPTYNTALIEQAFAKSMTSEHLTALQNVLRDHEPRIDTLILERQPDEWDGIKNPFLLFPSQPSVNPCPLLKIDHGNEHGIQHGAKRADHLSNSFRRRLRKKEAKLQSLDGYHYSIPQTDERINHALDAFFKIKPKRMAEQNLPDIFSDQKVQDFIRQSCLRKTPSGKRVIEIHTLECDDEVLAIFAGTSDEHRCSMIFNTYTTSDNARHSPGLVLLRWIVDHYAEKGYTSFDLGIGLERYKRFFCKSNEPLSDSFIPMTSAGYVAASIMSSSASLKRRIKQNPALMQLAHKTRGIFKR